MNSITSRIILLSFGYFVATSEMIKGQDGDEYDNSGVITFNSSSDSVVKIDLSATRSSQGFIFDCESIQCPDGPYQELCPKCDNLQYDSGATATQCYCFDSQKMLQDATTIRDSQTCDTITVDSTGVLVCNTAGSLRKHKKHHHHGNAKITDSVATSAPTPQFIATKSPTFGSGPIHVDFVFNCASGTCPDGSYQQFCPLCSVNTDSTTPGNDPEDSLSCECFNANGQMLLGTSTMWGFEACPKIVVDFGGELQCIGAGKNSGIRTYGGRRALKDH